MTLSNILLKSNINDVADFLCKNQEELEKSWKDWLNPRNLLAAMLFTAAAGTGAGYVGEGKYFGKDTDTVTTQREMTPREREGLKEFEKKLRGLEGEEPPPLYWKGDNNVKQRR